MRTKKEKNQKKQKKAKGRFTMKMINILSNSTQRKKNKKRRSIANKKKEHKKKIYLKKKLEEIKKKNKKNIEDIKKELKKNWKPDESNISELDNIRIQLISHLQLPIDILTKILEKIKETEKEEKLNDINKKIEDIKKIVNGINNMDNPNLFYDFLEDDKSKYIYKNLKEIIKIIEDKKQGINNNRNIEIIEEEFTSIQELFDKIYDIINDLILDEHPFYNDLEFMLDLLENIDKIIDTSI